MIKASEKASKILIRDFGEIEKLQVSKKGPADFVTNSDLKTEKIIIEELKKARPNYSFITEENGIKINKDKNNTWILDPIDGTINFLHGIPHFAISIALRSNNEITTGLIYDPIKDEMFYAEKDKGAFFNSSIIIFSAFISELVTKSEGPFFETCNFSISPKSLIRILEAFSLAFIITLRFAEIEFTIIKFFWRIPNFLYQ